MDFWTDWKYFNELFGNYLKSVHGQSISLGGDGVLRDAFSWAGFKDIEEQRAPAPLKMKSAAECLRFEKESFGALHTMLAGLDEGGKAGAWREIETELQKFESGSSFEGPCELIVIAGSA